MQLKILTGERQGQVIPLNKPSIMIGRTDKNDVVLPDPAVSRQHVRIFQRDGSWFLNNLQPDRTVYVNEKAYSGKVQLQPDMVIQIGHTHLQLEASPHGVALAEPPKKRSHLLPLFLGLGGGILILVLVFFLAGENPVINPVALTATSEAIALASATATPTITPTSTPTHTPTATPEPTATATPLPILVPQVGEQTVAIYTPDALAQALLDEKQVTWPREALITVPISFTNNSESPINRDEIIVGLFAKPMGELRQVPSFLIPDEDSVTIGPGETKTLRWLVVLPNDISVDAWGVEFGEFQAQDHINP